MTGNPSSVFGPEPGSPAPAGDFSAAEDPFALFDAWFGEAEIHEPKDPNAMTLATTDALGCPNARTLLLKGVDPPGTPGRGFTFFTNCESAKGRELLGRPCAALLFYWKSLGRQVRLRGAVTSVSEAEADLYFASRPRGSQIGAWASQQSRPLASRRGLEDAVARCEARFANQDVPRPPHWSGFRLTPGEMEFWHERPFRLHERVLFCRDKPDGPWRKTLLFP